MYDNDWLNVYNDTSTNEDDSEKICDGKKCDKENNKGSVWKMKSIDISETW